MNSSTLVPPCYNGRRMARLQRDGAPTHRVTLDLPVPVYERLRKASFDQRDSMNKICVDILDRNLPPAQEPTGSPPAPAPPSTAE